MLCHGWRRIDGELMEKLSRLTVDNLIEAARALSSDKLMAGFVQRGNPSGYTVPCTSISLPKLGQQNRFSGPPAKLLSITHSFFASCPTRCLG